MVTWQQVVELHERKPWLTNAEAATVLGCHAEYVRATCRRRGIKFALKHRLKLYKKGWDDVRWLLERTANAQIVLTMDADKCVVAEVSTGVSGKLHRAWRPEDAIIAIAKSVKAG